MHPHQAKHGRSTTVMSKLMGSELSVILISRLLLLVPLLLWQLGTGTTFNIGTKAAADNGDNTTKIGTLKDSEAKALELLVSSLQSNETKPVKLSLDCSNEEDAEIRCSCDNSNEPCSITEINLSGKKLDGQISSSIGDFEILKILDLSNNQLTGEIPSSLGKLQLLEILDLANNILTGSIPDNLTPLQNLNRDLTSNTLTGSIPANLTTLYNLRKLRLADNNLDGEIPKNLKGLQWLGYLDLERNKLTGSIPDSISYCKNLTAILLRLNNLGGTIPRSLGSLSKLKFLDLFSNSLSGHIPFELGKLSSLLTLNLDDNNLEGNLPIELGNLFNLTELYLSSNKFNGSIPETYAQLVNLEVFVVGGNNMSGKIPNYFGNWSNLTKLILVGNNFKGDLAAETFTLPKLQILVVSDVSNPGISFPEHEVISRSLIKVILRNCDIRGPIPEYIGWWPQLRYLDLSFNNLTGAIPDSFQNISYKLLLTNNSLNELPSWITSKQNRSSYPEMYLSYNNFKENCANSTCLDTEKVHIHPTRSFIDKMMQKETCRRKHNSLYINCGGEEVTVGKAHYHNDTSTSNFFQSPNDDWAYSYSGDYLWATINDSTIVRNSTCEVSSPEAKLNNNFRLAPVSLTYYGLCLSKGKYHVTLHFAETLYSKGEDNSRVGKRVFDVYIQKERVEKDLNIKEALGGQNEELKRKYTTKIHDGSLEIRFFWTGKGSLYNPPAINGPLISAISVTRVPRKLRPWEIAVIAVSCILFLLLLLAFMWRMGWIGDRELRETKVKIGGKPFTLKQIIDATRNFSPENELGRGRSGIVYKADLPNLTVAVKKLDPKSKAVDEIASEVYAKKALDLKHDNVVTLLASYSRRHLHLLIYEYMKHGSLEQVLFGTNSTEQLDSPERSTICQGIAKALKNLLRWNPQTIQKSTDSNPKVQLDWQKRFNICKGIAKGLKYLHERKPQIIHRNIKSTNILLDASLNPKISDFGLAKLYEEGNPYIAVGAGNQLSYMAPEYATRRAMTVKVDVFSFGILLLEIVSGKNNADSSGDENSVFLLDTASKLHAKQELEQLVYTRLDTSSESGQASIALNLAIMCTDQSPSLRPTMSQVVAVLERSKTLEDISKEINASA
ncbi:PREDICTED: probable LRR receptor-like serine/threonine-protein kinase At1g53430 isoform X2 [Populus euphratica]|uniref:non-specific serine/threonine protein kinase n=1 Tax=Populus euphratica TaxID=75702 RepID=A0AAJ6X872_POPEU|nr:PREDICTED: probable LRR receptor-like serine/threonine-protein kinase At1g53430 isoform X2 [Populus euphratica]